MCFLYETFPCLVHLTKAMSTGGCLQFVTKNWLGRPLNNGKDFPKLATQPTEMAHTVCNLISRNCFSWRETKNWKMKQMIMKFPPLRSEWKKRTSSGDSLQFPNRFSGKLLFHLTFNRNFWIFFLLNGKHPMYQFLQFILYTLNTSEVYKVNTFSLTSVLEKALSFAPQDALFCSSGSR